MDEKKSTQPTDVDPGLADDAATTGPVYDLDSDNPELPMEAPPVEAAYQSMVPADAVAPKVTIPVPQREAGVDPVMVGVAVTVAVTAVLVAVVHPLFVAST
jgi:hypothetical protein